MLGNDSVQIAATSRASAHAHALTATRQSVASETPRGVSASGHGRSPVAWRGDRGCRRMGNFPPCKALKTHEMRKESRFCPSRAADEQGATRGPRPSTIRTCSIRLGRSRGIVGWLDRDRQSTAAARRSGKFSALQSLENSQNANGISFRDDPINLISPGASLSRVAPPPGSFRRCPIGHRPTRLPTARPDVQRSSAIREATRRAGWFAKWRLARVTAVY